MATVSLWLKDKLFLLWYVFLYLVIELLTLGGIFILSVALSHWSSQLVFLACRYKLSDVNQTYILVYSVGILSAQVPKSWRVSLTPSSAHEFQQKKHPVVFGALRVLLIFLIFVVSLVFQFTSFIKKYERRAVDNTISSNELYLNDIFFISSLALLTFNLARVLQSYRKYNLIQCQKENGPVLLRFPGCLMYLIYYFGLVLLELIYTVPLFCCMSVVAFLLDRFASSNSLTFFVTVVTGVLVGHLWGEFEEKCISLDKRMWRIEPYFSTIHWDARLNVIVFTLVPLLSRWYFYKEWVEDSVENSDSNLKYILLCGCMSTTFLELSKSQTLFSYVVSRRLSTQNRVLPSIRSRNNNRVCPERPPTPERPRLMILRYFPLDLHNLFKEGTMQDQTSISTGTCTSLMNRMNNNPIVSSRNPSMKTCPRSSQGSCSVDDVDSENANTVLAGRAIPNSQQVFVVNRLEVVQQANISATTTFTFKPDPRCSEIGRRSDEVAPTTGIIKLKRCPSNLPIVSGEADDLNEENVCDNENIT